MAYQEAKTLHTSARDNLWTVFSCSPRPTVGGPSQCGHVKCGIPPQCGQINRHEFDPAYSYQSIALYLCNGAGFWHNARLATHKPMLEFPLHLGNADNVHTSGHSCELRPRYSRQPFMPDFSPRRYNYCAASPLINHIHDMKRTDDVKVPYKFTRMAATICTWVHLLWGNATPPPRAGHLVSSPMLSQYPQVIVPWASSR